MICLNKLRVLILAMAALILFSEATDCHARETPPALSSRFPPQDAKIIPMFYEPLTNPLPLVRASVNGSAPLWFLVDTGLSSSLVLEKWAVDKLGLRSLNVSSG